jgi:hypothetical protein
MSGPLGRRSSIGAGGIGGLGKTGGSSVVAVDDDADRRKRQQDDNTCR